MEQYRGWVGAPVKQDNRNKQPEGSKVTEEKGKALVYVRTVLKGAKGGRKSCPEVQAKVCKDYLSRSGQTAHRVYVDEGYSGHSLDRPGLQELLEEIENDPEITKVIALSPDRVSRCVEDFLNIQACLDSLGVKLQFVDRAGERSAEAKLADCILVAVSEYEGKQASERAKSVWERRKNQGTSD
jgi:DNA invertase Pin-like site-specific DNA recombinase